MSQDFFILDAEEVILDAKTRKIVAIIRNGEVFRDDDGARIAVFVGSNLYDLDGNFLGRLDGCTPSLPIALGKLLEGPSAAASRDSGTRRESRQRASLGLGVARQPQDYAAVALPGRA